MAAASSSPAVCYLPTNDAYDRWSTVYDTDGNFLQKIDDIEMKNTLFPRLLAELRREDDQDQKQQEYEGGQSPESKSKLQPRRVVVDLGCGTGRNTMLLLSPPAADVIREVIALDASRGMLEVARARLSSFSSSSSPLPAYTPLPTTTTTAPTTPSPPREEKGECGGDGHPRLHLEHHDLLTTPAPPPRARGTADAVVSTLVVEHVPLREFFAHVAAMLRPGGGMLLLSNMHADMGRISQAGFVDEATGVKVRPTGSYAHTVAEVVEEAARWGLCVLEDDGGEGEQEEGVGDGNKDGDGDGPGKRMKMKGVREVVVSEDMVEVLGPRSRKWVGVTCWFGCLFRKDGEGVD